MHTEHDERVQAALSFYDNGEVIVLDAEEKALLGVDYAYAVIWIDDYSQSHWIVDNLHYFDNREDAEKFASERWESDFWD